MKNNNTDHENVALYVHPVEGQPLWFSLQGDGLSFGGAFEGAPAMEPQEDGARCDSYNLQWTPSPHWRAATMTETLRALWDLRMEYEEAL